MIFFKIANPTKIKHNALFNGMNKLYGGNEIEISILWGMTGHFWSTVKVNNIHKEISYEEEKTSKVIGGTVCEFEASFLCLSFFNLCFLYFHIYILWSFKNIW